MEMVNSMYSASASDYFASVQGPAKLVSVALIKLKQCLFFLSPDLPPWFNDDDVTFLISTDNKKVTTQTCSAQMSKSVLHLFVSEWNAVASLHLCYLQTKSI